MFRKDALWQGLVPGLLIPVIISLALYKYWALGPWKDFYWSSVSSGNLTKLLALGCFLNLGTFFLFLKIERQKAASGVIYSTMFYVLVTAYYLFT